MSYLAPYSEERVWIRNGGVAISDCASAAFSVWRYKGQFELAVELPPCAACVKRKA